MNRRPGRLEFAVISSAREANLPETDKAAVLMARLFARALDDHPDDWEVAKDIGPKLIDALTKLGLTSAGRGVVRGKAGEVNKNGAAVKDELADLRAKHSRNA